MSAEEPDARLALADGSAGCSLWWRATPRTEGERVGAVGHFAAADRESGARILGLACAELSKQGCRLAFGPMDGNTWQRYRAVIERGDAPAFFLEPDTPPCVPECFADAGFAVAATYCSAVQESLEFDERLLQALAHRAAAAAVRLRPLNMHDIESDLGAMHEIALRAFERSFLFSPISRERFIARYAQLVPYVRPELVLLAERAGEPVAFAFGIPDALERARGAAPRTVILKTVAARPGLINGGLAHLLVAEGARAAAALGYRRAVHALMHEANGSLRWSERHGRVFRRYALFGKKLRASLD